MLRSCQKGRSIRLVQKIKKSGITQISNEAQISDIINKVIEDNPETVQDFNAGKEKAIHFLVGQVMKHTKGRAQPDLVLNLLKERIDKNS